MLKLINKLYRKDYLTVDIINSLKLKLISAEDKINDFYKQIFLDYATWYLELKEKEMAISKRLDDIDKRRNYVRTRLLGVGTATKEMLEAVANSIDGVRVDISFKDMTVIVNFIKVENNKYLGIVKRSLETMIPYHLDISIVYQKVNWGEVRNVRWNDTKVYTWGGIKDSVAGTIIGGFDEDFD